MNRHRSRSPRRDGGVAEAAKNGNSEQEIVSVAIKQLPADIRERLEKLFDEGLLKEGDLDLRSITVFASLNEGLQARVMNHMEGERIYVANARSKSGFLIATCDKAKTGCLDARGLGAIDPWRTALVAMATPKQKILDLKHERDFLDAHEEGAVIKITVKVGSNVESELGVDSVTVEVPLTECSAAIKAKLTAMGVKSVPPNKMMLHTEPAGFLKESRSFAYYNLKDGASCTLHERKRGGVRLKADHTVMNKRPKAQTAPPPEAPEAPKAEMLPGMPKLPSLPGLAGLQSLLAGTAPGALQGLAGLPGLPGLPKLGGLPGLPGLGGLPGLPKMGMPGLGGTGPAPGLPGMLPPGFAGKLGGLPMSPPSFGGGLGAPPQSKGGMPGGMPGMPSFGGCLPKAAGMM